MSMSKKDFIALADAIREHNRCGAGPETFSAAQLEVIALFCKRQNSNFKQDRWLDYIAGKCGPNGGAIDPCKLNMTPKDAREFAKRIGGAR